MIDIISTAERNKDIAGKFNIPNWNLAIVLVAEVSDKSIKEIGEKPLLQVLVFKKSFF